MQLLKQIHPLERELDVFSYISPRFLIAIFDYVYIITRDYEIGVRKV